MKSTNTPCFHPSLGLKIASLRRGSSQAACSAWSTKSIRKASQTCAVQYFRRKNLFGRPTTPRCPVIFIHTYIIYWNVPDTQAQ